MSMHRLLARQLYKLGLSQEKVPDKLDTWQDFLNRINKTYIENDQDRYLIERSMDISSNEMQFLNEKLEQAQHIARLGYWLYDATTDKSIWSKELFNILEYPAQNTAPSYGQFMKLVHPDYRQHYEAFVRKAINEQCNFEVDVKIKAGKYRWYRIICHCLDEPGKLTGIVIDINKEKLNEEKINELHQQFLQSARRAGMSEVATSILHNIGNILNSANLSLLQLKESLSKPYYQKLLQILQLMREHEDNLHQYLAHDDKGRLIPQYLITLGEMLVKEHDKDIIELKSLEKGLIHIKNIVAMQQCFSGSPGVAEKIYLPELIETALNLSINEQKDYSIQVDKTGIQPIFIFTDKSKLLQILVNVINNARDAVNKNTGNNEKKIALTVSLSEDKVSIEIKDNGIGISAENLKKIFTFGFTTKENGHGFGLHTSALSAQEMGGTLTAESEGEELGAVFKITLPYHFNTDNKRIFNE